jgi:hypothetical protein
MRGTAQAILDDVNLAREQEKLANLRRYTWSIYNAQDEHDALGAIITNTAVYTSKFTQQSKTPVRDWTLHVDALGLLVFLHKLGVRL